MSAHVDGGPSGGSRMGERTPIGVSGNWYCVHFGRLLANDCLAAPRGYVTELVCAAEPSDSNWRRKTTIGNLPLPHSSVIKYSEDPKFVKILLKADPILLKKATKSRPNLLRKKTLNLFLD